MLHYLMQYNNLYIYNLLCNEGIFIKKKSISQKRKKFEFGKQIPKLEPESIINIEKIGVFAFFNFQNMI